MRVISRFRRSRGFTLAEVLVVMAITALLAAVCYPSYASHVRKGKRVSAIAQLTAVEQAQDRWRANNSSYAALSDIGMSKDSAGGAYDLSLSGVSSDGYVATAQAKGTQDGDTQCRYLRLTVTASSSSTTSGPDDSVANGAAANNQCWLR